MCMRCSADGKWWLDKQVIHESKDSEPRAYGTMTALGSSQILAPFTEVNDQFATSQVSIAVSQGDGETFEVGSPIAMEPLCWAAPSGRLFERDGTLVMPVFGALSKDDLKQTRHTCGLFRSTDGGKTWGDWSVIASGSEDILSFEYCSVLPLHDGTILAVFTGRRLQRSADAPQVIMRYFSKDGGRTWSEPDQLCVGSCPALESVGETTTVCAYTIWCGWGNMNVLVSDDGMRSFYQDQVFVELACLPIPENYPRTLLYPDKELERIGQNNRCPFWAYNPGLPK